MSADAPADACFVCALLCLPEHHRVSRSPVPVASRHLFARSVLHHAPADGSIDVCDVLDRHAKFAAKSTGENDELHDAGDADGPLPELCIRSQSLLRSAKHRRIAAAMAVGARAGQEPQSASSLVGTTDAPVSSLV